MKDLEIELLDKAIEALAKIGNVNINIEHYFNDYPEIDATGTLTTDSVDIPLAIKIKAHLITVSAGLLKPKNSYKQLLLVANYVNPVIAERLKEQGIWFLDAAGNAYINHNPIYIYVKGNKPLEKPATRPISRAFQITGLKVVYALLCNPELVNAPYREIAQTADVALGTVGWVMTDLTQLGFIVDMGRGGRRLRDKRRLLERWVIAYPEKLRPRLEIARYKAPLPNWLQTVDLHDFQALWGGEVAADKLTHYLKPEIITIYLPEQQKTKFFIKNRLRKDPAGEIELLKTFWDINDATNKPSLVNPILIYADLIASGDPRNIETAQIIYDQELAEHFRED
ncbi:type IV toxin-antitoxin system AbiEi family antitoxin [Methyloglobulus sp.]|uniref:type IV toxin-antitoxin system AbiEi family antitoxin n=1 Tax=Methyloglobulus sp. TaxID=2518622 RepID=UPI0032B8216D